ncbi:MAG: SDR family NAD(P)-dependent oxidoreductase [Gemmataceae bacterium]
MSCPVAIVTGGAHNIGRAIVLRLAEKGYDIAVVSPEADDVQVVSLEVKSLGRRSLPLQVDVSREDHVQHMVRKTIAEMGGVDLLVNNAAIFGPVAPVGRVERNDWDRVLSVNLTGAFLCCKAVLPLMIERRRGKIVNMSSTVAKKAHPLGAPYAVSKAGLVSLTQTLAKEVGTHNIQVNAICAGPVEGDRLREWIDRNGEHTGQAPETIEAGMKSASALGRFTRPEDIADTVLFLASPAGDNITGQTIDITAGYGL